MKTHFRLLGAGTLWALAIPLGLHGQNEPLISVDITKITVGGISQVTLTSPGSGYTAAPTVTVTGGGGSGARLTATTTNGAVTGLTIVDGGLGYTSIPTISISSPGGQATATATLNTNGGVESISVGSGGSGYSSAPTVSIAAPPAPGTPAQATAILTNSSVTGFTITSPGSGYTSAPTVVLSPPGATATARVDSLGRDFLPPFQNESYGPVGVPIVITAQAAGTFPVGGYTYKYYVNGAYLGDYFASLPAGTPATFGWAPPQPGAYLLTVVAIDGLGHSATSLAVRYFATGTAIIGPQANTLVPNGSSVVIQGTATPAPSGSNAFLQRMEFYVDDVLRATDTTYPYSYIYTPEPTPTVHKLEVRGYDNNGNKISPDGTAVRNVYMVSSIGIPPVVRIVNPLNNASMAAGSAVNIISDAVAPDGFIKNVDFYVNGVLVASSQKFPFTASWTPQVPGKYDILSIAYDDKSNAVASPSVQLTVTGAFPTATIISPEMSGYTVVQGTTLPVTVRAAGPDGGIASLKTIEFLVDGSVSDTLPKAPANPGLTDTTPVLTEPFVFNWKSSVAIGTHRLAARVTGVNGLSITSPEITVNVVANQAPRIAITDPADSASLTMNAGAKISVTATDIDGDIDNVEFFANGTNIGSSRQAPFSITWTPTSAGSFELTAKATDNGGAKTTSSAVVVNVDPPPPAGTSQSTASSTVYRGDYGSTGESGRFALAVNRNNRGTLIAYSTVPTGKSYLWTDISINPDGSFSVRDANNQVALSGQTSATGVAGNFGGKTFIGPITPTGGAVTPLLVTGTLTGVPNSQVVAIVGGDGSVTLYSASGTSREVGGDMLSPTGSYSFAAPTGGRLTGTVANSASIVSGSVSGGVSGNFLLRLQPSRITNISTRAVAGSGDRTMVAGFVVSGSGQKPLLIRAVGPTLAAFGVTNPLIDPTLNLQSRSVPSIAFNNDWGSTPAVATLAAQVGAFALTPGSRDAALSATVTPGMYSAVVGGSSVAGTALVEIYDTDAGSNVTSRISNISTRAQVGAGDALIAGFVITGDVRKKVLIRAVGPTLANFGLTSVLADPKIEVLAGSAVIATNNDWTEATSFNPVSTTSPTVGAFPLTPNSKDAALVLQLTPGAYTVQITGAANTSGTVLVEIYDADL